MNRELLPIGSVVLLKGGNKELMIYGRCQKELNEDRTWDYIACPYPEGNINEEYMYLFNRDQIETVYFIGYQTDDEKRLRKFLDIKKASDEEALAWEQ